MENRGQLYDQSQFAELRSSNQGHASGYNDGFGAGLEAAMWLTFEVPRDSLQITSAHYVAPKIVVKKEHKNKTKKTPYAKPEDEPMRRIVVYKENLVDDSWEEMRPFGEGFRIHNMPPGYLQCSSCHVGFPDWYFLREGQQEVVSMHVRSSIHALCQPKACHRNPTQTRSHIDQSPHVYSFKQVLHEVLPVGWPEAQA